MRDGVKIAARSALLLLLPLYLAAGQDPQKLFLEIKELSASDPLRAETKVDQYLSLAAGKDQKIIANAYYLLGRINYFKSRNYISNQYYQLAIENPYAKEDMGFMESCYNNMGVNYEMQGLTFEAMKAYQTSLGIAEKLRDSVSIAQSWINLGLLNAKTGRFDKARDLTMQALRFFTRKKDLLNIALCYQNLGYIMSEQRFFPEATSYYHKSLFVNQKASNQFEVLNLIYNLGSNYCDMDDMDSGEKYLEDAYRIAMKEERYDIIVQVLIQRGENSTHTGNYAQAEKYLHEAMALSGQYKIFDMERLIFRAFTQLYAKSGNFSAYEKIREKMKDREKKLTSEEMTARTDEVQALFEFQQHARKIRNQENDLAWKRSQRQVLIGLFAFLALVLAVVIVQYYKARKYMRSLFENAVERTLHHDRQGNVQYANKHYLREVYEKVIHCLENEGRNETDITVIARLTGFREDHIALAIRSIGNQESSYPFFRNLFIEDLCRKMIVSGKKVALKKEASLSPFGSYRDFARAFREITGLWPQEFLRCCEVKIRGIRS